MMDMGNTILVISAVIPAIFLLIQINRADRLEKEPLSLILKLVFFGMFSTILASIVEEIGELVLDFVFGQDTLIYNILMYFIVVACAEEGVKYLYLKRKTWNSPEFNCQFDGVVYAVSVSLGFALWENIGYVVEYGFGTAVVRAITAVPGHACFGVFMGAYYGMARRYENFGNAARAKLCRKLALLVPIALHGAYDFIATVDESDFAIAFLLFVIGMFYSASRRVKILSKEDVFIRARYPMD